MSSAWRWMLGVLVILVVLAVSMVLYQRFLLDSNLHSLKVSLSILDTASGVGQAEAALLLVDQTLTSEMAKMQLDLKAVTMAQYVQGTLSADERQRSVADSQTMVSSLLEEHEATRPALLTTLDGMVATVQTAFRKTALLPRRITNPATNSEIDSVRLTRASRLDRLGQLTEAAAAYQKLLEDYPRYSGRATLKLRLGYVFQRNQDYKQAERYFREAMKETLDLREIEVAQSLLANLSTARSTLDKATQLQQTLATLPAGLERQRTAYELGSFYIQVHAMDKAAQAFNEAVRAAPQGELNLAARFKEGWCLRTFGRLDASLERFLEVIHQDPKSSWAAISYHQIAEIYKSNGDFEAAANAYERALEKVPDFALSAILQAQLGSVYCYDLKDEVKGLFHIREVSNNFPASRLGGLEQKMIQAREARLNTEKGALTPSSITASGEMSGNLAAGPGLAIGTGTPILRWTENFIPVFIEALEERLATHMRSTGVQVLSRRYSESEFREMVVRRIQERFPSQLSSVEATLQGDTVIGGGVVRMGLLTFPMEIRTGIITTSEKIHAELREVKIGNLSLPDTLRKLLDARVNKVMDQAKHPLRIKQFEVKDGYLVISVELIS